ncbi:hypothetical protein [Frankia sp. Cr2]|uniref:hypothetical protein n=1 Tax=Frankia sp. Cr2 TaxID=3073932 RepID=UPI002AD4B94F|nr:hypothetical protein [Frankia sp. Cr2]
MASQQADEDRYPDGIGDADRDGRVFDVRRDFHRAAADEIGALATCRSARQTSRFKVSFVRTTLLPGGVADVVCPGGQREWEV